MGVVNCGKSGDCDCKCYTEFSNCKDSKTRSNVIHCYDHRRGCHANCTPPETERDK
jgi:hypothetical protein